MNAVSNSYSIILQNMGLIKKCVSQITYSTYEYEDLVQEAVAILLQKIQNYDSSKGSLSTFIWYTIKNTLINTTQVLPEHLYKISIQINKAKKALKENGEDVNAENIARLIGVRTATCRSYIDQINSTNFVSLDEVYSDDESAESFGANCADKKYESPEVEVINNFMHKQLIKELNALPEIQKQIITLHYNLNNDSEGCLSYREIAKVLNINHQTVANIEAKGLNTIKAQMAA